MGMNYCKHCLYDVGCWEEFEEGRELLAACLCCCDCNCLRDYNKSKNYTMIV